MAHATEPTRDQSFSAPAPTRRTVAASIWLPTHFAVLNWGTAAATMGFFGILGLVLAGAEERLLGGRPLIEALVLAVGLRNVLSGS
jgi:hypothetical protein